MINKLECDYYFFPKMSNFFFVLIFEFNKHILETLVKTSKTDTILDTSPLD